MSAVADANAQGEEEYALVMTSKEIKEMRRAEKKKERAIRKEQKRKEKKEKREKKRKRPQEAGAQRLPCKCGGPIAWTQSHFCCV